MLENLSYRVGALVRTWEPEEGDAVLYGLSALFALLTIDISGEALYRQWAELAIGPYLVAAVGSVAVGWVRRERRLHDPEPAARAAPSKHWSTPRILLFLVVLLGATLIPLSLEVAWRSDGNATAHVQPEVPVVEQAGQRAAHGLDPYHASVVDGKAVSVVKGEPTYESFYPYLPVMTVFGLPSSLHAPLRLSDARIAFSGVTLLVVLGALALARAPSERKIRTLQVLTVLPTAALLLATGGDDMPVVAFLLLAMVLAQRRRPGWSGIVLGIVSAMKFTAWPLAVLALFAARRRVGPAGARQDGDRRAGGRRSDRAPLPRPQPPRVHRERDPVPARALRGRLAGRQPVAGPPPRDRVPRPPPRGPDRGQRARRDDPVAPARPPDALGRGRRVHARRVGDARRDPGGPRDPDRLSRVPDQLLRVGLHVPRRRPHGRGRGARGTRCRRARCDAHCWSSTWSTRRVNRVTLVVPPLAKVLGDTITPSCQ